MKITINESQLGSLVQHNEYKLPQFLYQQLKTKHTSLGDCDIFPMEKEYPFDYQIIKDRYKEVVDAVHTIPLDEYSEKGAAKELSQQITLCLEKEKPIKDILTDLCQRIVNQVLGTPQDTILLQCLLVDKIEPKSGVRTVPEEESSNTYEFDDINDIEFSNKEVMKRRVLNSLIQGASYKLSNMIDLYMDKIYKLDSELPTIYQKIKILNDYLLFISKEKVMDNTESLEYYVDVVIGNKDEKVSIKSQAKIFPYLLNETFRGYFELFASHGLPNNTARANYVLSHADFTLAEAWDLRFGYTLWNLLSSGIEDTKILPYYFASLSQLDTDVFAESIKEILSNTRKGKELKNNMIDKCQEQMNYEPTEDSNDTAIDDEPYLISDSKDGEEYTIEELRKLE